MTPVEKYLKHVEKVFQREAEFYRTESTIEGVNNVFALVYRDYPTIGYMTAVTYGLSLVDHEEFQETRPELCICVESDEVNWAKVVGFIANRLRGKAPFTYGNVINFGKQVSIDSEMSAFFLFAPTVFEQSESTNIDLGLDYKINWVNLYPMYQSEIEVYHKIGIEKFWTHPNFHPYKVNREKITSEN